MDLMNLPIDSREFLLSSMPLAAGVSLSERRPELRRDGGFRRKYASLVLRLLCVFVSQVPAAQAIAMEEFIEKAVSLRVDGVDMTGYYFKSTDAAYLASLRHLAYRKGIAFSGAACGATMVQASRSQAHRSRSRRSGSGWM